MTGEVSRCPPTNDNNHRTNYYRELVHCPELLIVKVRVTSVLREEGVSHLAWRIIDHKLYIIR